MRRARPTRTHAGGAGALARRCEVRHALHPPYRAPQGCAARSLILIQLNTLGVKKVSRQCSTTDAQR